MAGWDILFAMDFVGSSKSLGEFNPLLPRAVVFTHPSQPGFLYFSYLIVLDFSINSVNVSSRKREKEATCCFL